MKVFTVYQRLPAVVLASAALLCWQNHTSSTFRASSFRHKQFPHESSHPPISLASRYYIHKPIFSKRLAIKHTPPFSQKQTSQTQLIRTNAIRTPIPLDHIELIVLVLPTRRPATHKPLLPTALHLSKPSRIRTAVTPSPRPPTLICGGIVRLRLILRSIHR